MTSEVKQAMLDPAQFTEFVSKSMEDYQVTKPSADDKNTKLARYLILKDELPLLFDLGGAAETPAAETPAASAKYALFEQDY
ncbi:hypothetical protein NX059_012199 [Plenodomus lindquistii]|nr:hypothetical protein NX059_012199 [Plenodomus lindquistii]